jgi:hypothetical protein
MTKKELLTVVTAILHSGGESSVNECMQRADYLIQAVDKFERPASRVPEGLTLVGVFDHLLDDDDKKRAG